MLLGSILIAVEVVVEAVSVEQEEAFPA